MLQAVGFPPAILTTPPFLLSVCVRVCVVQGLLPAVPAEQLHQLPGGLRHLLRAGLHG